MPQAPSHSSLPVRGPNFRQGAVLRNTVGGRLKTAPTITLNLVQLCLHHSPSSTASGAHPKNRQGLSNHRLPSRNLAKSVLHAICTPPRSPAPAPTRPVATLHTFSPRLDISRLLLGLRLFSRPSAAPPPSSAPTANPVPSDAHHPRRVARSLTTPNPLSHPLALVTTLTRFFRPYFLLDTLFFGFATLHTFARRAQILAAKYTLDMHP